MTAIRTERLSKNYRQVDALHDLTLEIPAGSIFALVGANGAGKTTAIKTIMNILRPTRGRAEVLGVDSRALGSRELQQIGYYSENQQLPDWMTVRLFLDHCRRLYPTWEVDALVRQYELPLGRRLLDLSRGMRVKAALASILAPRPKLIVLDEPFGGLDVLTREQVIESVLDHAQSATVLFASHDLAEIESFASHVGYLDAGRLQFVEEIGVLSDRFRDVEVVLADAVDALDSVPPHWLNPQISGAVLRFVDSRHDAQRLAGDLRSAFTNIESLQVRPLGLRRIFVALAAAAKKT